MGISTNYRQIITNAR